MTSTWNFYGGFEIFDAGSPSQTSTWIFWGGFEIFGPITSTSTGAPNPPAFTNFQRSGGIYWLVQRQKIRDNSIPTIQTF